MSRRKFIINSAKATAGLYLGSIGFSAKSYARIKGANDRVSIGVVGFSDRFRQSLFPSFLNHNKELNVEIIGVSDIWKVRREEGVSFLSQKTGNVVTGYVNNEAMYANKSIDAVIISTADFQHAIHCAEAVKAGRDVYVEKPFAETMEDARMALKAVKESNKIVQVGSQRRSGPNYRAAADFIQQGKFGDITNLEYRLFWAYSSGIPGQWMSHQIDTVNWFSKLNHPRSVVANGGVYMWKDGRRNWDTMTAVFDYGPAQDKTSGFQVMFTSRMHNGDEKPAELYFSNGGELNLITNKISSKGGLQKNHADAMGMQPNLLPNIDLEQVEVVASANTGGDKLTSANMRNWLECVRSRKTPNAPVEAGYNHSIATIMTNAAARTGQKVTFDEKTQEVMAGGKVFKY